MKLNFIGFIMLSLISCRTYELDNISRVNNKAISIESEIMNTSGAFIAAGVWKEFMSHNLGADFSADPLKPSAAIHGAKYQWGPNGSNEEQGMTWVDQVTDQKINGDIIGWNTIDLPSGRWKNYIKTKNVSS